ncbi:13103_t:CDS:10 [Entrophospora sp. SA101]|nr:13103_t:CDS:10 [Entrophospora sp. SA101]
MSTIIHNLSTEYINIGCNRVSQVAAWGIDGLVAFGANNYVALYYPENPECKGVIETLEGHTDKVNCVNFINRGDEFNQKNIAIVSGSVDKTVRIWKKSTNKWVNSAALESHVGSVNTLGLLRAKSILVDKDLIATGSADGTVKIWERTIINDTQALILACGSTDKKISLFVQKNNQFIEILSLQGHENWIRSVAFATYTKDNVESNLAFQKHYKLKDGDLLLASASQDKYVRLWKMSCIGIVGDYNKNDENGESNQSILKEMMTNLSENTMPDMKVQLSTKAHIIDINVSETEALNANIIKRYNIIFEALLTGHDNCVYSVNWHPPCIIKDPEGGFYYHQPMALLTASSDKSMMIWKPEIETGVWVNLVTVGEIGGYTLGFFGGLFSPNGNYILAHGHTGAFHLWKNLSNHQSNDQDWQPQISISGHFNSVQDISWNPTSQYLISVSLDQTSRLFAPWCRDIDNDRKIITWHEIGRPQIHGYDLKCIAFINQWRFVSGADEKILRVFDAPKTFIRSLSKLSINKNLEYISSMQPVGANLPALGLSNKAIFQSDIEKLSEIAEPEEFLSRQNYLHSSSAPNSLMQTLNHPPYEEHLLQHTLWPEIDKLYGHGYEIVCVDASHDGKYLASACRSTIAEHAVIRLYDTKTMKELSNPLQSSSLTVTRTKFSHNDEYLLTVSRDRSWTLFKRCNENLPYKYLTKNKAHGRIIWDCSWSHDDKLFATASRDKTVKFWIEDLAKDEGANDVNDNWNCVATIKLNEAVTAVDFSPIIVDNGYLISIGLENGKILFYHSSHQALKDWKMVSNVEKNECHVSSINRLMWSKSPIIIASSSYTNIHNNTSISKDPIKKSITKLQLASCGDDGCIRILNIFV